MNAAYVGPVGPDNEAWRVGGVLLVLPVVRPTWPQPLKDAVQRRRQATLDGTCACGATVRIGADATFVHDSACPATNENIARIASECGLRGLS